MADPSGTAGRYPFVQLNEEPLILMPPSGTTNDPNLLRWGGRPPTNCGDCLFLSSPHSWPGGYNARCMHPQHLYVEVWESERLDLNTKPWPQAAGIIVPPQSCPLKPTNVFEERGC